MGAGHSLSMNPDAAPAVSVLQVVESVDSFEFHDTEVSVTLLTIEYRTGLQPVDIVQRLVLMSGDSI